MKSLYLTIISLLISLTTFCELPNTFKYQAVIRNADGETLANKDVTINLIILKDGSSSIYSEEYNVTTNSFGLVNLEVGSVNESKFANIDWSAGNFQLAIEMDGELIGTTDILAVPYANCAAKALSCDFDSLTNNPFILTSSNTAVGYQAYYSNISGWQNTAIGSFAMYSNETGYANTAVGHSALKSNTTGTLNTAFGQAAMDSNISGIQNAAAGYAALQYNKTGNGNVASGFCALRKNTSGSANTAIGFQALTNNDTAVYNTAVGYQALRNNVMGQHNTSVGSLSLPNNKSGNFNVACGVYALQINSTGNKNTAIGYHALGYITTGSSNTAIGYNAGPSSSYPELSNTIAIGNAAYVSASNTAVIGNSSVTKLYLGSTTVASSSDGRFKENVKEDVPGLDFINLLRPVTFTWDLHKLDEYRGVSDSIYTNNSEMEEARLANEAKIHTGFIAQEVEAAADSVDYEFSGVGTPENENSIYTLSYSEFVVPLVKAVQEQQDLINALQEKNEQLESELSEIKELLNTLSE